MDNYGDFYGHKFGKTLWDFTRKVDGSGKKCGKLKALERRHRDADKTAKADRIVLNNFGKIKLDNRRKKAQAQLRTEAIQATHAVVDKASTVGSEDLTGVIAKKKSWGRDFKGRMGFWANGVLAEALESVTKQRSARLVRVNAVYSSQVNSRTGCLEGKRKGDHIITPTGEVLHSDVNAARNVRDRINDITRFMPYKDVRKILLRRSSGGVLPLKRLEFGAGNSTSTECG